MVAGLGAATAGIAVVAGGVMALVGIGKKGLDLAISNSKFITGGMEMLNDSMGMVADILILMGVGFIGQLLPAILPFITNTVDSMIPLAMSVMDYFQTTMAPTFEEVGDNIINGLVPTFQTFYDNMSSLAFPALEMLVAYNENYFLPALTLFSGFFESAVAPFIRGTNTMFTNVLGPFLTFAKDMFGSVIGPWVETIGGFMENHIFPILKDYVQPILSGIGSLMGTIVTNYLSILGPVIVGISDALLFLYKPYLEGLGWFIDNVAPPFFDAILLMLDFIDAAASTIAEYFDAGTFIQKLSDVEQNWGLAEEITSVGGKIITGDDTVREQLEATGGARTGTSGPVGWGKPSDDKVSDWLADTWNSMFGDSE